MLFFKGTKCVGFAVLCTGALLLLGGCVTPSSPRGAHCDCAASGGGQASAHDSALSTLKTLEPLTLERGGPLGSLGLNVDTYLSAEMVSVPSARMRLMRLEALVSAMHRDMKILAPAVQDLHGEGVSMLTQGQAPAMASASELEPAAVAKASHEPVMLSDLAAQEESAMKSDGPDVKRPVSDPYKESRIYTPKGAKEAGIVSDVPNITGVRVGEHTDRVRLVFDLTQKAGFSVDLDNEEKLLVVEVPKAHWQPAHQGQSFPKVPVVKSYTVNDLNAGQGRIFVWQLDKATKILAQKTLPSADKRGARFVIDLAR